jgi:hypothetical protein
MHGIPDDDIIRRKHISTTGGRVQAPDIAERGGENLLDAGLRAAARGWKIFPCDTQKKPLAKWKQAATTDPVVITAWAKWQLASMWARALPEEW